MNPKIAVFPGSFDPFTIGHESIVMRGLQLFDKIIIGIGSNSAKNSFFSIEKRVMLITETFTGIDNVEVEIYDDLTVEFCRRKNAKYILRGLRTSSDFEYERAIAQVNHAMAEEIETVFMLTLPEHTFISSTLVREIIKFKGDARKFLPEKIDYDKFINS